MRAQRNSIPIASSTSTFNDEVLNIELGSARTFPTPGNLHASGKLAWKYFSLDPLSLLTLFFPSYNTYISSRDSYQNSTLFSIHHAHKPSAKMVEGEVIQSKKSFMGMPGLFPNGYPPQTHVLSHVHQASWWTF